MEKLILNARLLSYRKVLANAPIDKYNYEKITLEQMCNKAGILKRITSDILPNYYITYDTDENIAHITGKYAGIKSLKNLPEQEKYLRILEIFAYSFLDYPVRECVCGRGFFKAPLVTF